VANIFSGMGGFEGSAELVHFDEPLEADMTTHTIGTREQWLKERLELLEDERELTHRSDELARRRQELPWVRIDKEYRFETDEGGVSLADLFRGRSQLLVYHFMFGADYTGGCPACSAIADGFNGIVIHLANHDVMFSAVSRAPFEKLQAYKRRMGWSFPWASSFGSDFNHDFGVSFTKDEMASGKVYYNYAETEFPSEEGPGASVFYKGPDGSVFHTYSAYARGLDILVGTYNFLDLTPKGRDEAGLKHTMAWVRHHDKYMDDGLVDLAKTAAKGARND